MCADRSPYKHGPGREDHRFPQGRGNQDSGVFSGGNLQFDASKTY